MTMIGVTRTDVKANRKPILSAWRSVSQEGAPYIDWDIEQLTARIRNKGDSEFGVFSDPLFRLTEEARYIAKVVRFRWGRKAAARAAARGGDAEAKRLLSEYEAVKRRCAAYSAHGRFSGRGGDSLISHSGYQIYDADDVPEADAWALRCRLVDMPETELVHETPFGVRALVRIEPTPATAQDQRDAFHAVDKWAQRNGLPLNDTSVKDIARLSYLWEDRAARLTPGDAAVRWTAGAPPPPRRKSGGGKGGGDCDAPRCYLSQGDDDDLLRQVMAFVRDELYYGVRNRGVFNALTAYAIRIRKRIDVQSAEFERAVHSAAAACYESLRDTTDYDLVDDAMDSARSVVKYQRRWEPDPDRAAVSEYTPEQRRNGGLKTQMLRRQQNHDRDLAIAFYHLRKGLSLRDIVTTVNRSAQQRGIRVHCTISVVRSVIPRAAELLAADTAWRRRVCGSRWLGPVKRRQPAFQLRMTPRKDNPRLSMTPLSDEDGGLTPALGAPNGGGVIIADHTEQVLGGKRCSFLCRCRSP